jgi:eukaryotic-like serine/threonine-protein kinase
VLAALLIWLAVDAADDGDTEQAGPSEPSATASSPAEEPPSETQEQQEEEEQQEPTEQELESFASDYVSTAVSDPDTSWQRLTPAFQNQSGGREGYDSWWDQFESAQARDVSADPDAMTVSYTVDYVYSDGRRTSDNVTLQLVEQGGDLLVAGES